MGAVLYYYDSKAAIVNIQVLYGYTRVLLVYIYIASYNLADFLFKTVKFLYVVTYLALLFY